MADNVITDPGTGGATLATDDIGGVHHQRVKVQYGVDGAATDVSNSNPMPIGDAGGSITIDNATLTSLAAAINSNRVDVNIAAGGISGVTDDAALTPGTTVALPIMFLADEASPDSVDEGDGGIARMTLDRRILVVDQPHTSGGLDIFRSIDLDETEEEVKASAGQVYSMIVFNMTAAPIYVKFYNDTAANVTVGTTTPVLTIPVPANADSDGAGFVWGSNKGFRFNTAICVAATTGVADNDTTGPGTNECIINLGYK